MIKCAMLDGSTRYFSTEVVHSINKAEGDDALEIVFQRVGSGEVGRARVSSFQLIKTGTTYR